MEFEFKNFGHYLRIVQDINDIRESLNIPPIWLDYETIHELHSYKDNYLEFAKPNDNTIPPLLLKLPAQINILVLNEIRSADYTHITLAFFNYQLLILFLNKPLAIDQIIRHKDCYQISIIRVDRQVHLWGVNVVSQDSKKRLLGPEHIELGYKQAEYTVKVNLDCIAAQLVISQNQPIYKRKSFYHGFPAKSKAFPFFKIVPIKSALNEIMQKLKAKSRGSAFQKRRQKRKSRKTVAPVLPPIILSSENSGVLFADCYKQYLETKKQNEQQYDNCLKILEFQLEKPNEVFSLFRKSNSETNQKEQMKLKPVPSLTKQMKQSLNSNSLSRLNKLKIKIEQTKQISNFKVTFPPQQTNFQQRLHRLIEKHNFHSLVAKKSQIPAQFKQLKWFEENTTHPFLQIPLYLLLSETDSPPPIHLVYPTRYVCQYPSYNGSMSSIYKLSAYLQNRDSKILSQLEQAETVEIYELSKLLGLKNNIKTNILILGILNNFNHEIWQYLCQQLCLQQVDEFVETLFYDYFRQKLDAGEQQNELIEVREMNGLFKEKVVRNMIQIQLSLAEDSYDVSRILANTLRDQKIGVVEMMNRQSLTLFQYSRQITHFYACTCQQILQSEKSYFLKESKIRKTAAISNINVQNFDTQGLNQYSSQTFQFENTLHFDRDTWTITLQQFSFMKRQWRVFIQKDQKASYIFLKECGLSDQETPLMNFSSIVSYIYLSIGSQKITKTMFYSFANGQNSMVGIEIPHLEDSTLNRDFKLKLQLKPCYIHSFCLQTFIHSSYYLFEKQERDCQLNDVLAEQINSEEISKHLFPNCRMQKDQCNKILFVQKWFNQFSEMNLYWLLNHNLFRAPSEESILEILVSYYAYRNINVSQENSWLPLLFGLRHSCVSLHSLLELSQFFIIESAQFSAILGEQIEKFKQGNRYIKNKRYHSIPPQKDINDAQLRDLINFYTILRNDHHSKKFQDLGEQKLESIRSSQ